MALIPRQRFPWEQQAGDEPSAAFDDEDTNDVHYYSSAPNNNNQLWVRRPGYMDMILPPAGFSIWDLPQNKLQTTAVALTFVATAALVTCLAGAGMLAILVTGAVVSAAVLLLVTVCAGVIGLVVTGVPIGYAAYQLVTRFQQMKSAMHH